MRTLQGGKQNEKNKTQPLIRRLHVSDRAREPAFPSTFLLALKASLIPCIIWIPDIPFSEENPIAAQAYKSSRVYSVDESYLTLKARHCLDVVGGIFQKPVAALGGVLKLESGENFAGLPLGLWYCPSYALGYCALNGGRLALGRV